MSKRVEKGDGGNDSGRYGGVELATRRSVGMAGCALGRNPNFSDLVTQSFTALP